MLKFFMMDGKWGASDVAEEVDYPQTSARFRTRNMAFRLTIFTVVVRAMGYLDFPSAVPTSHERRSGNAARSAQQLITLETAGISYTYEQFLITRFTST